MIADDAATRAPGESKLREIGFLSARKCDDTKSGNGIVPQELTILISRANQCVDGPFRNASLGHMATLSTRTHGKRPVSIYYDTRGNARKQGEKYLTLVQRLIHLREILGNTS